MSRRRPCHTGGDSLSFKEFALALWTFASLDINGIGRFTYEIYKNDQRDGIDGTGITDFIEGVFGKGNVAGRERARNELERIRREEGGVIDRYEWEEFVRDPVSNLQAASTVVRRRSRKTPSHH